MNKEHEKFIKRTFALAKKGAGNVSPNPLVGCVIVKNGKIISEGFHSKFGGDHAEIVALKKCKNSEGATLYVNLEPCGSHGKTPPCADEIIKRKIKKVIFSINDPNPRNFKKGEELLIKNRVEVKKGILEKEARELNRFFIKFIKEKTPYVTAKVASSLDGKIADRNGNSKWISVEKSRREVQKLRKNYDAILIGRRTCEVDNPSLNLRDFAGKSPIKILLDPEMKISTKSKIFSGERVLWIVKKKSRNLSGKFEIISLGEKYSLKKLLIEIEKRNIISLLIEGGGETNAKFFEEDLVDEVIVFLSPKLIGGKASPSFFDGIGFDLNKSLSVKDVRISKKHQDFMIRGYIKKLW